MLKILLFAIALQIAQSTYVEKNQECAKGPSYWCQSVAISKECGAFKHCLETVWTKHSDYLLGEEQLNINTANPNPCTNCLQCMDAKVNYCPYVKNFNAEIELLKDSKLPASTICKLLDQCKAKETNKEEQDEGFDHRFKCGVHPRQRCDTLDNAKRCSTFDKCMSQWTSSAYHLKPQDSLEAEPNVAGEKTCGFCIFLFNKLHEVLEQNQTEIDIEQYLLGACALLPTKDEANKCQEEVQKYVPEIILLLRNNVDPGIICRVLKMCDDKYLTPTIVTPKPHLIGGDEVVSEDEKLKINSELREFLSGVKVRVVNSESALIETPLSPKKSETLVTKLKASAGVGCELCQIVLSAAKRLIENKVDDKKVIQFIDKELCARLGQYKTACTDYVNLEGEQILDLLRKAVDPALICEMMGFCLKVQASGERLYDLNVRNNLNCTLCKMVFAEVKKKLSQHEEEQHIIDYVDKNLCERVGKSKAMCKTLIDAYGPIFLEIIARDVNPQQLCEIIGMCSKSSEDLSSIPFTDIQPIAPAPSVPLPRANETCVVCEFVVKLLSEYANKNSTEPEIEKLLNMICDKMMPASVQPQCTEFVNQYGPVVISLIVNGIKPDQICTFIGLCPKSALDLLLPPPPIHIPRKEVDEKQQQHFFDEEHLFKHRSREEAAEERRKQEMEIVKPANNQTLQCSLCLYVAELVDTQLKQNKTEEQITREVELVCNLFPSDLRQQCKSFLDEYMPYILQLIAAELDAESACAALKICKKQVKNDIFRRTFVNKLPTKN